MTSAGDRRRRRDVGVEGDAAQPGARARLRDRGRVLALRSVRLAGGRAAAPPGEPDRRTTRAADLVEGEADTAMEDPEHAAAARGPTAAAEGPRRAGDVAGPRAVELMGAATAVGERARAD